MVWVFALLAISLVLAGLWVRRMNRVADRTERQSDDTQDPR
mgnify:CR=1 FL=1